VEQKRERWTFWKSKRLNFKAQVRVLCELYGFEEEELVNNSKLLMMLKKPKNKTLLVGEESGLYEITDLERAIKSRLRSFNRFFSKFHSLFKRREVSLLFITLTTPYELEQVLFDKGLADEIRAKYRKCWLSYKKRFEREGVKILGYLKLVDVGWRGEKIHFHNVLAVPRMKVDKIYDWLKPDSGVWPWHSRVEFVRKDVRKYLADYLRKPIFELPRGWRGYEVRIK